MSGKRRDSTVVTERRLRPVYDCLDVGNNKTALQEAEKLLKKQPDLVCAKALRALALIRLLRFSEATVVLEEIDREEPDEEYTLQALTYCYRDLGKPEKITTLYERATKKHPQNEEFLSHLMMAYVRVGEYKKQNHIAMQLYKLRSSKNPYYFWSVMSTVMQAYEDPKLARTMYLPLAERMIEKFIKSEKLNAEAEVKLYILILEMQEKYSEAVAVIQGDLMTRFVKCMWESNQKLIELWEKLNRWQEVYDTCQRLLPENHDDWFLWSHMFSAAFELVKDGTANKSSIIDQLTTIVLNAKTDDGPPCRGPPLARMHLIGCLLERDYMIRSELGEPRDLLLQYFHRFGDRPSLIDDIKPYLWLLGEEQQNEFIGQLEQCCGDLPLTAPSDESCDTVFAHDLKQSLKHQAGLQLTRCLGRYATVASVEKQNLVAELIRRYESALDFGNDLLPTEVQPADEYLILAVHTMWDIYLDVGDAKWILETILLCEQGLKRSSSNFRIKSLLMKLYSLVGGAVCLLRICESMDMKYILRDTLWYLVCDHLSPWGLYGDLVEWCRVSLTFYNQSEKEIVDCVVQCYKAGSFTKILEFFDFRKKLRNSFHFHACDIWRRYFSLINDGANVDLVVSVLTESSAADDLTDSRIWQSFNDNSDYSIVPSYDPDDTVKAAETQRQETYQQQLDQLRYYQLILALLSFLLDGKSRSCCQEESEGQSGEKVVTDEGEMNGVTESDMDPTSPSDVTFSTILNELRAHCKHCCGIYPPSILSPTTLTNPVPGVFGLYLAGNYLDVLILALESSFAVMNAITSSSAEGRESSNGINEADAVASEGKGTTKSMVTFPPAEEVQRMLKAMFSSHQLHGTEDGFPFMQICHVSFLVQTISTVLVAVSLVLRRAQNRQQTSKEKKQKKKKAVNTDTVEDPLITEFLQFASIFCQAAETTLRLVDDLSMLLDTDISRCSLTETTFLPMKFCISKSEMTTKLESSYKHSIKELQRVMAQNLQSMAQWYRGHEGTKS